jgi:hypothetical protein
MATATISHEPLNATQIFVLKTFASAKSEEDRNEVTSLYLDYLQKKLDKETQKWWQENDMTPEKFDAMTKDLHFRTPYK